MLLDVGEETPASVGSIYFLKNGYYLYQLVKSQPSSATKKEIESALLQ